MTKDTGTLRLGPLPRTEFVKLTLAVPADIKASLDRYADLHSQLHGEEVDAAALIPYMLAAFMARDRGFKSLASKNAGPRRAALRGGNQGTQAEGGRGDGLNNALKIQQGFKNLAGFNLVPVPRLIENRLAGMTPTATALSQAKPSCRECRKALLQAGRSMEPV